MKAPAAWLRLVGAWGLHHVVPPTPAAAIEDIVITQALQIRRTLAEVARLQRPVALQAADGHFLASAELDVGGSHDLLLRLNHPALPPDTPLQWPLNAAASGPRGMAMFTLRSGELGAHGVLQARWPEQVIQVQSRRHFRLAGLGGTRRRAWLRRPGSGMRLPLRDLSEEGVGAELASQDWLWPDNPGPADLHLDDGVIPVPVLQVVHSRAGRAGNAGAFGARLLGIQAEHLRTLRRWIAAAQADGLHVAGDQA